MQSEEKRRLVAGYGPATSWHMAVWWMFKTGMWFCMWWEAKLDGAEHTTYDAMHKVMRSSPKSTCVHPLVAHVAHNAGFHDNTEYKVHGKKEWDPELITTNIPTFNFNSMCQVLATYGFTPCTWAFFQLTHQQVRNPNFSLAYLMQIFLQNSIRVEWVTCFNNIATEWLQHANNPLWRDMMDAINLKLYVIACDCSFNKFNQQHAWTQSVRRLLNVFYHLVEQCIRILKDTTTPASKGSIATFFCEYQETTMSDVLPQDILPTLMEAFENYIH